MNKIIPLILIIFNSECFSQKQDFEWVENYSNLKFNRYTGDSSLISDFLQFNDTVDNDTCWALLTIACDGFRTYCDVMPYSTTFGNVQVSSDSLFNNYTNFPSPATNSNINSKINDCTSLFGKNVFIKATTQNNLVYNFNLYSPQKINFTGTLADSMSLTISKSGNFNISWNADPYSTKGVLITLLYTHQNEPIKDNNFGSDPIFQNILIQDNGSYTLTSQILSIFPTSSTGKQIIITLNRGNFNSSAVANIGTFPVIIHSKDKRILYLIP